ncbi:MAG: glycosyltransferase family 4 protein, partial [Flavobacteriales bacterium]
KIVVLSVFSPFRGGIAQFNTAMCKELEEQGNEVVRLNFTTQYPKILFPGKTQYIENSNQEDDNPARVLSSVNPLTWFSTRTKIKQLNPDLIIVPYWISYLAPALTLSLGSASKPPFTLGLIHNAIPHEAKFWDPFFIRKFVKKLNATLCLSQSVAQQLESLPSSLPNLTLTHPIYNHFGKKKSESESKIFLESLGLDASKKTLLFFGLIREYKGLKVLIQAFNLLNDEYQLIIAGECYDEVGEYEQLIDKSDHSSRIKFVNEFISDDQVPFFFSAADAVVLPYLTATQSGVTAIAMHFGLPVIASKTGGLHQFVDHNNTGLLVEPIGDPIALKDAVNAWFSASRKETEVKISHWAKQFSWEKFCKDLIEFVERKI